MTDRFCMPVPPSRVMAVWPTSNSICPKLSGGGEGCGHATPRHLRTPPVGTARLALFGHYEMRSAVLLPARLVVVHAERTLFAVADGLHAIGGDAQRNQKVLGCLGTPVA